MSSVQHETGTHKLACLCGTLVFLGYRANSPFRKIFFFLAVLWWICIGFNADPNPAFYLNADSNPDEGSQCQSVSGTGSCSDFAVKKG
jgi:hypothetical protein